MFRSVLFACACTALAATGCKKSGGPTGGGGGGWLVGDSGLMVNIHDDQPVGGYELGETEQLNAIACRYAAEAWVVGQNATVLYTIDGGLEWEAQLVPTTAHLKTLATQDDGPVFIGGDGAFLVTKNTGISWTDYGDGITSWRSMSAAHGKTGVLALSEDGGLWQFDNDVLVRRTTLDGARAVHQSTAGDIVMAAGSGIYRSTNGGATFQPLTVDPGLVFDDIRVNADGTAVAVGEYGVIANIDAHGAVSIQYAGDKSLHTLHIHHDTTGYTAGDDGQVLITDDLGLTWRVGPNVGRTVRGVDEIGFGHR
jgi:photosystem II stability/assembly factor-like uncharacterized protein